jgi:aldose 1-epimerase
MMLPPSSLLACLYLSLFYQPRYTLAAFVNNGTLGSYDCSTGFAALAQEDSRAGNMSHVGFLSTSVLSGCPEALPAVYPYNRINLRSPDDSLRATFMPHGASMVEFWTRDRHDVWRDVIAGYDNVTNEGYDPVHPYFGPQVGRYANRIKNGTFSIDGTVYHTPLNENNFDTLHGGHGFDNRSYTVTALNASSVQFTLHDKAGNQGFPADVVATAQYSLNNEGRFIIHMDANVSNGKSPVMLSHHVYWALHGYNETQSILNHTLHMPKADRYIKTDGTLIPVGPLPSVKGTRFDFQSPRTFAERFNETHGVCGTGCQGWDSCFVMSEHDRQDTILTLTSPESGIRMQVKTDQDAIQIYTCDGISGAKGSIPRKRAHGGDGTLQTVYENHSCVVVEMEDYSE